MNPGKRKWGHITNEEIEKAIRAAPTIRQAAKVLGIPRQSLHDVIDERGIKAEFAAPERTPEDVKEESVLRRTVTSLKQRILELESEQSRKLTRNAFVEKFDQARLDVPKWLSPKLFKKTDRVISSAFLSDVHADEVVNPSEINYVNGYDRATLDERMRRFFERTVQVDKHIGLPSDGLVLYLGGDMISGNIHEELAVTNEEPVLATCLHVAELICAGIDVCLQHFAKVHVVGVTGNHGRMTRKPQAKRRAKDNFDWLIYKIIEQHYVGAEGVTFNIPDGSDAKVQIYGQRVQLTHGDQFYGGTGIAGLYSPIALGHHRKKQRESATNSPYDLLIMGHWHQLKYMGDIIINGSLKGYDEYAASRNFPFEPPQQAFWLTDARRGLISFNPIYVAGEAEPWMKQHMEAKPQWLAA